MFPKAANTNKMKPLLPNNATLCGYFQTVLIGLDNSRKPLLLIVRFVKYSINFTTFKMAFHAHQDLNLVSVWGLQTQSYRATILLGFGSCRADIASTWDPTSQLGFNRFESIETHQSHFVSDDSGYTTQAPRPRRGLNAQRRAERSPCF